MSNERGNTEQELKVLQSSATGRPNPLRVLNAYKEQLDIIGARFQGPMTEAEASFANAVAEASETAITRTVKEHTAPIDSQIALAEERFALQQTHFTAQAERLMKEIKETEKGPLKKALKEYRKFAKGVKAQISNITVIRDRLENLINETEKVNAETPDWLDLDLNGDGVLDRQDLAELDWQIKTLQDSLENYPAVKIVKKHLQAARNGLATTEGRQQAAAATFDEASEKYETKVAEIRKEIKEERRLALGDANEALAYVSAEKQAVVEPFAKQGKALIDQELKDLAKYGTLKATSTFERVTKMGGYAVGSFIAGIGALIASPFVGAYKGLTDDTMSSKANDNLLADREKRVQIPENKVA